MLVSLLFSDRFIIGAAGFDTGNYRLTITFGASCVQGVSCLNPNPISLTVGVPFTFRGTTTTTDQIAVAATCDSGFDGVWFALLPDFQTAKGTPIAIS